MSEEQIENLARKLREAAFPGASPWAFCSADTRDRWIAAAVHADAQIQKASDAAYRKATAISHELGQHAAAAAIRRLRFSEESNTQGAQSEAGIPATEQNQ